MRNIKPLQERPMDALGVQLSGTLNDIRNLVDEYRTYDELALANPCRLEELEPLSLDGGIHDKLYRLYDSQRKEMKSLKDRLLKDINDSFYYCPYCGVQLVEDLDHYIPRSEFPEYSVHIHNLIPLCHRCNQAKSNLWRNEKKKRLFFNAYYDVLPEMDKIVRIEFVYNKANEFAIPKVDVSMEEVYEQDPENVRICKETFAKIKIIKERWETSASEFLKIILTLAAKRCIKKKIELKDQSSLSDLLDDIDVVPRSFIDQMVWDRISDSTDKEVRDWLWVAISARTEELISIKTLNTADRI